MIVIENENAPAARDASDALTEAVLLAALSEEAHSLEGLCEELALKARLLSEVGIANHPESLEDTFVGKLETEISNVRTNAGRDRVAKEIDRLIKAAEWSQRNWSLRGDAKQGAQSAIPGAAVGGLYGAIIGSAAGPGGAVAGGVYGAGAGAALFGGLAALAHAMLRRARSKEDLAELVAHLRRLKSELEAKKF